MRNLLFVAIICLCSCQPQAAEIEISWTAVGDNGMDGIASGYEIIYSLDSNDVIFSNDSIKGWKSWPNTTVLNISSSMPSGSKQEFTLVLESFSTDTTYYAAIKAYDDVGNYSIEAPFTSIPIPEGVAPATVTIVIVP